MTADWVDFPHAFLAEVSNSIINKVRGINRVVYDISSKPPPPSNGSDASSSPWSSSWRG